MTEIYSEREIGQNILNGNGKGHFHDDQNVTTLCDWEIRFLKEALGNISTAVNVDSSVSPIYSSHIYT